MTIAEMMAKIVEADTVAPTVEFTEGETAKLVAISARFQTPLRQTFSESEIKHMEFIKWLIATGRTN